MKRLRGLVQALIVMPMVIPPVVAGLLWRILLIPKYGGIHALLYGIGIQAVSYTHLDVYKRQVNRS